MELYTAAQALEYRQDMLNAARTLALRGDWQALASKIAGAPRADSPHYPRFEEEVRALMSALASAEDFHGGVAVRRALANLREHIAFMQRDRAMDGEVRLMCELVASGRLVSDDA
jgi:histidine ammonia-lyase